MKITKLKIKWFTIGAILFSLPLITTSCLLRQNNFDLKINSSNILYNAKKIDKEYLASFYNNLEIFSLNPKYLNDNDQIKGLKIKVTSIESDDKKGALEVFYKIKSEFNSLLDFSLKIEGFTNLATLKTNLDSIVLQETNFIYDEQIIDKGNKSNFYSDATKFSLATGIAEREKLSVLTLIIKGIFIHSDSGELVLNYSLIANNVESKVKIISIDKFTTNTISDSLRKLGELKILETDLLYNETKIQKNIFANNYLDPKEYQLKKGFVYPSILEDLKLNILRVIPSKKVGTIKITYRFETKDFDAGNRDLEIKGFLIVLNLEAIKLTFKDLNYNSSRLKKESFATEYNAAQKYSLSSEFKEKWEDPKLAVFISKIDFDIGKGALKLEYQITTKDNISKVKKLTLTGFKILSKEEKQETLNKLIISEFDLFFKKTIFSPIDKKTKKAGEFNLPDLYSIKSTLFINFGIDQIELTDVSLEIDDDKGAIAISYKLSLVSGNLTSNSSKTLIINGFST